MLKPCKKAPVAGLEVCPTHGVNRDARTAAERRIMEREAEEILNSYAQRAPDQDPGEIILDLIAWTRGKVDYCRARVQELSATELVWGRTKEVDDAVAVGNGPSASLEEVTKTTSEAKPHIWVMLLNEAERDLAKLAVDAVKVNLKAREVEMASAQAERYMLLLDTIIRNLGHDPASPETAEIVRRSFTVIEGGLTA